MNSDLIKIAAEKGFVVDVKGKGFSVKKNGVQVRFCFNEDSLSSFLHDTEYSSKVDDKLAEKNTDKVVADKVISKTVVEVREVVITDINMSFSSMVGFIIKWSIASIPALILLSILFYVAFYLIFGISVRR